MRKAIIIITSVTLITISGLSLAQKDRFEHFVQRITEELELKGSQAEELKQIMQEQHAKKQALREETNSKLKLVLNEEQMAKMKEMRRMHYGWHSDKRKKCMKKDSAITES